MAIAEFTPSPPPGSDSPSLTSSTSPMSSRRLTVSCHYPNSRGTLPLRDPSPMPFLPLRGRWLDQAGFAIGASVRVLVTPRRLVLEVIEDET